MQHLKGSIVSTAKADRGSERPRKSILTAALVAHMLAFPTNCEQHTTGPCIAHIRNAPERPPLL
eukprot:scaffold3275_cov35-Tisochrysis_lutea.AAC.1